MAEPLRFAWVEVLRGGYTRDDLRSDLMAGLTVGVVALPLSMGLAIASGVPPQHGIYTAIIAGALIAATGGARMQVSGPTAAFVAILAPISSQYGLGGLCVATAMAGFLLLLLGLFRLGRMVQFVPYPVTTGFTAGIGFVIAVLQLPDFFGLAIEHTPHNFPERAAVIVSSFGSVDVGDLLVGGVTLAALLLTPKLTKRVPAPLLVFPAVGILGWLLNHYGGLSVDTIASRFTYTTTSGLVGTGVPSAMPSLQPPWNLPGPGGAPLELNLALIRALSGPALAIAVLGAIESLLSAVVADASAGTRHDPDAELIGQGIGNLIGPFFGGIAATGALARTATNIRSGARSPLAAIVHALFLFLAIWLLAPLLGELPMASMAALLLVVAYNMSEVRHAVRAVRTSPRSDALVLVVCFVLTVVFDMVIAIAVGVVLASFLFMRRMIEVADIEITGPGLDVDPDPRDGVLVYRLAGPLFFGAAHKAMSALDHIGADIDTVVFDLSDVPAIDATGLVNLASAMANLRRRNTRVVLIGLRDQPRRAVRHGRELLSDDVEIYDDLDAALTSVT